MSKNINHPDHYNQGGVECIDAIEAAGHLEGFCTGNVIKYLWRWKDKGGLEDLKKARWYIDKLIQHLESQTSQNTPSPFNDVSCEVYLAERSARSYEQKNKEL